MGDGLGTSPLRGESTATSVQLLRRARHGDRAALDELFHRYVPSLRRWAKGRLAHWARSAVDTADIVQDAVLQTFRRLDHFEPRGRRALQAYLRQAVQNRIYDEHRRFGARAPMESLDETHADPGPSPFENAASAELQERYRRAVKRLRATDRELIVGHIELGYSHEQLALLCRRRSADTARVALRRALVKLAEEMRRG